MPLQAGWRASDAGHPGEEQLAARRPASRDAAVWPGASADDAAAAAGQRRGFLAHASALLASSLDHRTALAQVAELAVPGVADWCLVHLADDLARGLVPVAVAHEDPAQVELAFELSRRHPPRPAAPCGPPAALPTAELYPELSDEVLLAQAHDPEHLRVLRALGARSALVVPMTTRGRTLGALTFVAAGPGGRRFGAEDLGMAEELAHLAALACDNARLDAQAQEAVRAREEVVAVVSHDLKNPLNAILMSSGLLRRSAEDPEQVRHHADTIERAVGRMRDLVRDLLDLARLEAGRFTLVRLPHDMGGLVADALALFQPLAAGKGVALAPEPPAAAAVAACDRERVLQVLSNLLGNALAFTPRGGRVAVRWSVAGTEVVTQVSDTGPGIPEEEQRHVFERFWRSRSTGQGTGLGLSIAKGIVDAHGGRIWVESRGAQGARFLFTLPLA